MTNEIPSTESAVINIGTAASDCGSVLRMEIEKLKAELERSKAAHRSCAETAIRIHAELKAEIEELEKTKGGEE